MKPEILYEDDWVLAIGKPSGMVVNRGFGVVGQTLQEWIEHNFSFPLAKDDKARNGMVHRLDKETSGVVLIAKTQEVFEELQRQFKDREVEKEYLGLVHGDVMPSEGVITAPIGRIPKNRMRFGVLEGEREALTEYQCIKTFTRQGQAYSLVTFKPKTGRTHQIRVHAKYLHHPVVSDPLYAGRKMLRSDHAWCPRLFLHAAKIAFIHPKTHERVGVEAPLPSDLQTVLSLF